MGPAIEVTAEVPTAVVQSPDVILVAPEVAVPSGAAAVPASRIVYATGAHTGLSPNSMATIGAPPPWHHTAAASYSPAASTTEPLLLNSSSGGAASSGASKPREGLPLPRLSPADRGIGEGASAVGAIQTYVPTLPPPQHPPSVPKIKEGDMIAVSLNYLGKRKNVRHLSGTLVGNIIPAALKSGRRSLVVVDSQGFEVASDVPLLTLARQVPRDGLLELTLQF